MTAADQPAGTPVGDWAGLAEFARRRMRGEYEVDEYGFDPDLAENLLAPLVRPVFERWFRVEVRGIENVPADGAALIVGNHSGTIPIDAVMAQFAVLDRHPAHRHVRMLAADLAFSLPFFGELARKGGATLADPADVERLLGERQLVGVWPEGFKGIGKPFRERYKLRRFGRGGFVAAALRTGAPLVPLSVVGAEEAYPMIADAKPLARLLGLPYLPITPTFPWLGPVGLVPLPSKWVLEFGEPISTADLGPDRADDPMFVFHLADQVRDTIQTTLHRLLAERGQDVFG